MTNGLPPNFVEEWGALRQDVTHVKKDVQELQSKLPCLQPNEKNPMGRIDRLEKRMGFTEKIGYAIATMFAGIAAYFKFGGK